MKKLLGLTPDFVLKEEIILRDFLALERTRLANERTLLSYIRAALYLFLGGMGISQLEGLSQIKGVGYLSLVLSVLFVLIGVVRFVYLKKQLRTYYRKLEG